MKNEEPTVISLQQTVDLVIRKYGSGWLENPEAKCIVIWVSAEYLESHIMEIVPELYDLCMEFRSKGSVRGHQMPILMPILVFSLLDPTQTLPQKDSEKFVKSLIDILETRKYFNPKLSNDFEEKS